MATDSHAVEQLAAAQWAAYENDARYLAEQLQRLDLLLQRSLDAVPERSHGHNGAASNGFALAPSTSQDLLDESGRKTGRDEPAARRLREVAELIEGRVRQSWQEGRPPRLEWLAYTFSLSPFERDVLVMLLAQEVDRKYEKIYACLQDDAAHRRPSVELIVRLLCNGLDELIAARALFNPTSPLLRNGLLRPLDEAPGEPLPSLSRCFGIEPRVADFLLHNSLVDPDLHGACALAPADLARDDLRLDELSAKRLEHLSAYCKRVLLGEAQNGVWLEGAQGAGKRLAARAICGELSIPLLVASVPTLVRAGLLTRDGLRRVRREARLFGAAVYFERVEDLYGADADSAPQLELLLDECSGADGLVFLGVAELRPGRSEVATPRQRFALPLPDPHLRRTLWREKLAEAGHDVKAIDVAAVADRFQFTGGQIANAIKHAEHLVALERGAGARLDDALLARGCRRQCAERIVHMAEHVAPAFTWDDMILSDDRVAQLKEICDHVRLRERVFGDWGFDQKLPRGRGLSALFSGPSGTGKTMAAEVLAHELGMDLYKVDLSCVVSKYIGETEKNLSRVFTETEHSDSILFFDEADALFGKRSEVKDSHDRYANIEINYLLQRMERFEGAMCILSTNQKSHLDQAFSRRLRFAVEFPLPKKELRARIWQTVLPATAPRARRIDIDFLATSFELSGGNIRNAVLSGAFLAAREGSEITTEHLVLGVKREYQKLGRICTRSDFGRFFQLVKSEEGE